MTRVQIAPYVFALFAWFLLRLWLGVWFRTRPEWSRTWDAVALTLVVSSGVVMVAALAQSGGTQ